MRVVSKNQDDTFRVKAYAGTNGVLLAFDVNESRKQGLLGFAISQKEGNRNSQWLLNSLTFPDKPHTLVKWSATPSNIAPIQKFRWADYSINSGVSCTYQVYPVYGSPSNPELDSPLEVTVKTDDGKPKDHKVHFNRAVAASQSFGRKFADLDKLLTKNKKLPIEEWPDEPRKWLENGLLDSILQFINRANDDKWALDVAIYEYELPSIVKAINAAHKRKVNVRILYHSKVNDAQTDANEQSVRQIPAAKKRARITSAIFHDKFMVLSKVNETGKRTPQAALCGSTNFTENGVYRQANVVHVTEDKQIAATYLDLFEQIWRTPSDVIATRDWINANNQIDTAAPIFVGFSPRSKKLDLVEFVNVINFARQDLLFATAFALPEDILDALLGGENDSVLRYGIQNTASRITGFHADRTAEFVTPALLPKGLEGWVKEGLRGQKGNLLVHTKAIVVNFTGDNPIVISGSHNLSAAASTKNDENFLVIRGNLDLADRYGLEILRFYEHYRFRYSAKLLKLEMVRPLATDDSWANLYFESGNLKESARLRFSGR